MRHFKVTVEYDGTQFVGFQYQKGLRSVQGELEQAILRMTGQAVRVSGAGRTDTGVHALGQVVSFGCETRIPEDRIALALNSFLPRDVSASRAEEVDERFHARFSAKSRAYVYVILNRRQPSALFTRYVWYMPQTLDLPAMQAAAAYLRGEQDYRAWANELKENERTFRNIHRCVVRPTRRFLLVHVEANAFLHGMVRNIVGTLVDVGTGKRRPEAIPEITQSCRRAMAGPTAPARGLCLVRVRY